MRQVRRAYKRARPALPAHGPRRWGAGSATLEPVMMQRARSVVARLRWMQGEARRGTVEERRVPTDGAEEEKRGNAAVSWVERVMCGDICAAFLSAYHQSIGLRGDGKHELERASSCSLHMYVQYSPRYYCLCRPRPHPSTGDSKRAGTCTCTCERTSSASRQKNTDESIKSHAGVEWRRRGGRKKVVGRPSSPRVCMCLCLPDAGG